MIFGNTLVLEIPRKLFFFDFGLMYCDLLSQYINVRKLFKGGNYSRGETILGNTVCSSVQRYRMNIAQSNTYDYDKKNLINTPPSACNFHYPPIWSEALPKHCRKNLNAVRM